MALVTIQRSPSVVNSPHCSLSDIEKEESEDENGDSECFFAGKGTALILPIKDLPSITMERRLSTDSIKSTNSVQSNSSDIQQHLQQMFILLRRDETLKMAVKLESQRPNRTRYLAIVSRSYFQNNNHRSFKKLRSNNKESEIKLEKLNKSINLSEKESVSDAETKEIEGIALCGSAATTTTTTVLHKKKSSCDFKDIEESCLLGIDCNEKTTIGLVLPILADTTIHLDGDGGFSISVFGNTHIFKPVSVQAMWSALQSLHKVSRKARENNFYPGGPSHHWIQYYKSIIDSDRSCLNEWNAMDSLESIRPPSPDAIRNKPTQKEEAEKIIKMKLREIMMSVDLDEVTSKYIRGRLEELLNMDLNEYKSFIDKEMLLILGQMDAPTKIFEHVYLGSEWNASNLEELQKNGVCYILNVTREIDNFFPGTFKYLNIRVYDDEKTNLLKHWDNTYKFISEAKKNNSKILVHCKMGVSRSASVVVAYAMKAYNWDFNHALNFVKTRRSCIKPNKNFLTQLETYRGMLDAMKNKEKLQRSKSETNLKAAVKDARLLPGSEPTPLIQALSRSSKNTLCAVENLNRNNNSRSSSKESHRKTIRRSSSTSPKIVQNPIIILKQQSQSLENLTPQPVEGATIEELQKNVRHTDVNGQNYSITQNQILHIQKSIASTSSGTEIASTSTLSSSTTSLSSTSTTTQFTSPAITALGTTMTTTKSTVKSLVSDLESSNNSDSQRKTKEDRKSLNLLNLQSLQDQEETDLITQQEDIIIPVSTTSSPTSTFKGPVWTSSSKVIHQPSKLYSSTFQKHSSDNITTSNITRIDNELSHQYMSSSSSIIPPFINHKENSSNNNNNNNNNFLEQNQQTINANNRLSSCSIDSAASELGSSQNTSQWNKLESKPSRYLSSSSFETTTRILPSRNGSWGSYDTNRKNFRFSNPAIVEGQVFDRGNNSDRNPAATFSIDRTFPGKRTKLKSDSFITRDVSHFLSAGKKEKFLSECEIANYSLKNSVQQQLSVSAPEYPILLKKSATDRKLNRSTSIIVAEKVKFPNNVQSLKKNFEAKVNSKETILSVGGGIPNVNKGSTSPSPTDSSLTGTTTISTDNSKLFKLNRDSQQNDLSVKCLVNKYQFHHTGSRNNQQHHHRHSSSSSTSTSTSSLSSTSTLYRGRPHSCYESRANKPPDIGNISSTSGNSNNSNISNKQIINNNDCRPPPGPTLFKTSSTNNQISMTLSCRKLQQHGRTHPLTRLSKPKVCNSPTYHTM